MANKSYTVGWICAIKPEYVAAVALLDGNHDDVEYYQAPNDNNAYTLGKMGKHHVVIAVLPNAEYGLTSATSVAKDMLHSFPNVRIGLMVGIGGGAPTKGNDIRLGDIVVSSPFDGKGGVLQYDFGKTVQDQDFHMTGHLNQPPVLLRTAVAKLQGKHEMDGHRIDDTINSALQKKPRIKKNYSRPQSQDRLYAADFVHRDGFCCTGDCSTDEFEVQRRDRDDDEDDPAIHYGLIASGNQLMKDALIRDKLAKSHNILCFEMEAAGLMNHFPCLVIRGICDYSDSHKHKLWQGYAAMGAAAYAKELLEQIVPSHVEAEKKAIELGQGVYDSVARTEVVVSQISGEQKKGLDRDILDWLTKDDYGVRHSDILREHQKNTGQWLLNSEEFKFWIAQEHQVLFCPGLPGAGKTVLASIVIDHLFRNVVQDRTVGIAFIYFNYQERERQNTTEKLLSCLIKQLCEPLSSLPDEMRSIHDRHTKHRTRPSVQELSKLVRVAFARYSKTFLIFDAVDECQEAQRNQLLKVILDQKKTSNINILATSRHNPDVERLFTESTVVEILATNDDIREYINGRLDDLPSFVSQNLAQKQDIVSTISEAVDGMFLLARLFLDSLEGATSQKEIRQSIKSFITGDDLYDIAYEEAMRRIRGQLKNIADLAMKVLLWIVFAEVPLTESELRHALSVEVDMPEFNEESLVQIDLVSACAGLVTVDKRSRIVRLVHYTAQDYLWKHKEEVFPNAADIITDICITYLSFSEFTGGPVTKVEVLCSSCDDDDWGKKANGSMGENDDLTIGEDGPDGQEDALNSPNGKKDNKRWRQDQEIEAELERRNVAYPFYRYAASYWGLHALLVDEDSGTNHRLLSFLKSQNLIDASAHACCTSERYRQRVNGLHIAAHFGLERFVKTLLKDGVMVTADSTGSTPLHWAASCGETGVARLLLENGNSIEARDDDGLTPLNEAVILNQEDFAQFLLKNGASVEVQNRDGRTPLAHAAISGHESIARLLIEHGALTETQDNYGYSPLMIATLRGHEDFARLLIEFGASLNNPTPLGSTPLLTAAVAGNEAIVRLLIESGASVEALCRTGSTVLHYAASQGCQAVVSLLLDAGAPIEAHSAVSGRTPLGCAAVNGHTTTIRLLLNRGAFIEGSDNYGSTPLHVAAHNGHQATISLLLDRGAFIEGFDNDGSTPLHVAVHKGHQTIISLLLDRGALIEAPDSSGDTALHIAAQKGDEATVSLLLDRGALTEAPDGSGDTALHIAAQKGDEATVSLLLDRGASIEACSKSGGTPLYHAARRGHTLVSSLLLDRGASTQASIASMLTPLHGAAYFGHEAVCSLLIERGASLEALDDYGRTPLDVAVHYGEHKIVSLMLQREREERSDE